jgi:putative DNA primase/helicase
MTNSTGHLRGNTKTMSVTAERNYSGFVPTIWSKQPGKWFCLAYIEDMSPKKKKIKLLWLERYQFERVAGVIDRWKQRNLNIFFCPHGFTEKRRKKEFAVAGYIMYSDMDDAPPSRAPLEPTWLVRSSPGRHYGFWHVDEPVTEEINQAWTYALGKGADKGGWDFTQILRVPGTRNYKPEYGPDFPRVASVGGNRKKYRMTKVKELLPKLKTVSVNADAATELYRKYEDKLHADVRRELFSGKPVKGKRSSKLHHLGSALLEAGATRGEAFCILWSSPWAQDRYGDNPKGEELLRRDLDNALEGKMAGGSPGVEVAPVYRRISEVTPKKLRWIWPRRIPRGKVTILSGDGDIGKGHICAAVAAAVSSGGKLPRMFKAMRPGNVVYLSLEDDAEDTLRPRLEAAGADIDRCIILDGIKEGEVEREFDFTKDLPQVDAIIQAEGKISLLIIDPLADFIPGNVSSGDDAKMRNALKPLRRWAAANKVAVLCVLHLNKKTDVKNARQRTSGTVGIPNLSRSMFFVGLDPNDEDVRLMFHDKSNLAKKTDPLAFTIKPHRVGRLDSTKLEWLRGYEITFTSEQLLDAQSKKDLDKGKCADWLCEALSTGEEVEYDALLQQANARGYTKNQLNYAGRKISGIRKRTDGFQGKSVWSLPAKSAIAA